MPAQTSTFDLVVELLRVIAQVLWPLTIIVALVLFRTEIRSLVVRLRRGKFLGQELELAEESQKVDKKVEAAEKAERPKPIVDPSKDPVAQLSELRSASDRVRRFLEEAAQDKLLALLRIWVEIEQEVRTIVASSGFLQSVSQPGVAEYVRVLAQRGLISNETADSIITFYQLRTRLVHGHLRDPYADARLVSLIDSGLRLIQILRSVPRETYKVRALVPFYSDPSATQQVTSAFGVLLEIATADGKHRYAIFPTTRSYAPGQMLSWEWNLGKFWGPAWYKDPDTGEIKHAWDSAGEFAGRPLEVIR